jgi:hypothetical protein
MRIRFFPNDKGSPAGKLADAELHFETGPLTGLKLVGFAVWARRTGEAYNVTFPARSYAVNGERRSFALLRPIEDSTGQESIRDAIIASWRAYETMIAAPVEPAPVEPAAAGI